VYFLMFASLGMSMPFLPLLFSLMVSPAEVGILSAIGPLLSIVASPGASALADGLSVHRLVMVGSTLLGAVLLLPLLVPDLGFPGLLAQTLAAAIFGGRGSSILDASTVAVVGDRYGRIRLWGAVSFGICSLAGGQLITDTSDPAGFRPVIISACGLGLLAAAGTLAVSVGNLKAQNPVAGAQAGKGQSQMHRLRGALCQPRVAAFLSIVFLSGCASGLIDTFLYVHISRLGASGGVVGLARFITCAAEVPLFRAADWLIRRFGVFGVLALAQAAYVLRQLNYVALTPETVVWVLPSEVLHGFTYAVLWSACCYYANAIAPDGLKASLQGVVGGVHWGLGVGTGATAGGLFFGRFGGTWTFLGGATLSSVALAVAVASAWRWPPTRPTAAAQGVAIGEASIPGAATDGPEEKVGLMNEE
jgi:PPP family 3-phenylpropionic acid transporter